MLSFKEWLKLEIGMPTAPDKPEVPLVTAVPTYGADEDPPVYPTKSLSMKKGMGRKMRKR